MNNIDGEFLLEIWDLLKEHIHQKDRETIAHRLVAIFEEYGLENSDLYEVEGTDRHIDKVIKSRRIEDDDYDDSEDYGEWQIGSIL